MAPDQAAPVPAGWYPDPYAASELRWWDGVNWTDSVHPPVAPEPPATPPVAPPAEPQQPEPASQPEREPAPQAAPEPAPAIVAPATPAATPVIEAPPVGAHSPIGPLPSRRELRARAATTEDDHSDAAGAAPTAPPPAMPEPVPAPALAPVPAPVSAPSPSPTPAPAQAPAAPPSAFDWLPDGAALGTGALAASTPASAAFAAPSAPGPSAPGPAAPPSAASTGPVPATNAWVQEPASVAVVDDLYRTAATRKATTSGWFIAVMPLIAGILSIAAVKGAENYPRYLPFEWWMLVGGVLVVLYLVTLLLAVADRSKLDWAGYHRPAHWAWALLTAPVYLLVRTIAVKRETGRTSALLWVWLILAAALVGAWFAIQYLMPELLAPYTLPFL